MSTPDPPTPDAIERLRERILAHITRLEDADRDLRKLVFEARRELREGLQLLDQLSAQNETLANDIATKDDLLAAALAREADLIARLAARDADVERLEAERLSLVKPPGAA